MRDFTKKMDARMLELPELIEFAERINSDSEKRRTGLLRRGKITMPEMRLTHRPATLSGITVYQPNRLRLCPHSRKTVRKVKGKF